MDPAMKRKRQTKAPYIKWTKVEEEKLLSFLRENVFFEKPTAQRFYRRFMDENGIESDWCLIRSKVRNLRASYKKVKVWQDSTGAGALNEGETIEDVVLKKCPFFYELEDIFGYKEPSVNNALIDTEITVVADQNHEDTTGNFEEVEFLELEPEIELENISEIDVEVSETSAEVIPQWSGTRESAGISRALKSRKGIYSRTALSDIMQVQTEVIAMKKTNFSMEFKLREQELELQKEKFLFEKQNRSEELQLKEKEIEVHIQEIHMKERIAMKKLELKKEIEMEKLKRTN